MRVFAGCDGGGTKCLVRVVVCDDTGEIVGEGRGISGAANVSTDPKQAERSIVEAWEAARDAVSLAVALPSHTRRVRMVAALAGAGDYSMQTAWTTRLQKVLPFEHVGVVPDASILFAAAQVEGAAVSTVVGTGSIAWARNKEGEVTRAGGLGPKIGDEGSAYWIGRQALRYSLDESPHRNEKFASHIVEAWRSMHAFENQTALSAALSNHQSPTRDVARIAPVVFELAAGGSEFAKQIIDEAEHEIADLLVEATLGIETSSIRRLPWVCAGGVAVNQTRFLQSVRRLCDTRQVYLDVPIIVCEPVDGAVLLAIRGVD